MVGITGYGGYVPPGRITVEEIARHHGQDAAAIAGGLKLTEKAVAAADEDSVTLAVEAARIALARAGLSASAMQALYAGSESKVYAVKPNATLVGDLLGFGERYFAADLEFACKAGTAAMQTVYAMVKSGMIAHGMAVGSDTAQSRPGDVLEYSAAAGAAAFTLGSQDVLVEIEATLSVSSDTPDFWRGAGDNYPTHMGRFTGAPSYDAQLGKAARGLLADLDAAPADFTYAVLHTPNGKFPRRMAKQLGFTPAQTEPALIVDRIGNTYSAAALLALCRVLDIAAPGDRILLVSYGSGAGSDAFSLRVTDALPAARSRGPALQTFIDRKVNLDYAAYAARRGLFRN